MLRQNARLLLLCIALLGGCSLSGGVKGSSIDYTRALEDVTNNMLVTNVLLARDQAPLHFTDLSQIRGSLQLQSQLQIAEPYGYPYASTSRVRDMVTGTLTVATNPTFDVVPLNTKEFTAGITAPIDIKNFWYYLNRGEDSQTLIHLLFVKLDIDPDFPRNQLECEFLNVPNRTYIPESSSRAGCYAQAHAILGGPVDKPVTFQDFVPLIASIDFTKKEPMDFGPDITISGGDLLRGAGSLATAGLTVTKRAPNGRYHVTKESKDGVVCFEPDPSVNRPWVIVHIATLGDPVDRSSGARDPALQCTGRPATRGAPELAAQLYLYVRSVEAIFQYLGGMLTYDDAARAIPFYVDESPRERDRFSVSYEGSRYHVAEAVRSCGYLKGVDQAGGRLERFINRKCTGICGPRAPHLDSIDEVCDRGDQTLFVLSVLNQLLNLYKKASDIPTTPAVQAVP